MFSSGMEYEFFLETHCFRCRRHVDYEKSWEETNKDESPNGCPIEVMLEVARWDGTAFPSMFVYKNSEHQMTCGCFINGEHPMLCTEVPIGDIWKFKE